MASTNETRTLTFFEPQTRFYQNLKDLTAVFTRITTLKFAKKEYFKTNVDTRFFTNFKNPPYAYYNYQKLYFDLLLNYLNHFLSAYEWN